MKKDLFSIGPKFNGQGPVQFCWQPEGTYLAACGSNKLVHLFDRNGEMVEEIALQGPCLMMDWDKDSEILAVIQQGSNSVLFWDKHTRKTSQLDTNIKEPLSFIAWSKTSTQLAIGSSKGNILFYNKKTQKKIPVLGKHARKINSGAWNMKNYVTLGSEDRQLSVFNAEGELIDQTGVKSEPMDIMFSEMKNDKKATKQENTISINLARKTIYLYNLNDRDNPIELAFQPKYGQITCYKWFGDGYMMLGFSEGYFVVISTHMKEIGQELFSSQFFTSQLSDICFSATLQKTAICGDSSIKVINVGSWKQPSVSDSFTVDKEAGACERLGWTKDGLILTVSTANGHLFSFLTKVPLVSASYETKWAKLSSLRSVVIMDSLNANLEIGIDVNVEPQIMALGPSHIAVGRNNHLWFYRAQMDSQAFVMEKEYLGTVEQVFLTDSYVATLAEGKCHLHALEQSTEKGKIFPEKEDAPPITCVALTNDFLIYGTAQGGLHYFYLEDWSPVNEFRHQNGNAVRKIFPNGTGTRLVFMDNNNDGFIYNPVNDHIIKIPEWNASIVKVMWDAVDWGVFVAAELNCQKLATYVYVPNTTAGPTAVAVNPPTKPSVKYSPILVHNGVVTVQAENGAVSKITLLTHDGIAPHSTLPPEKLKKCFLQNLSLNRLKECWEIALKLKERECWLQLSKEAMRQLETELALNVQRQLSDPAMVLALQSISPIEEKNLLAGHVALLFKEYTNAEQLFVSSSRPITALEMRRDLLHWDQALNLAKKLAVDQIPFISREYAQQLEFKSEYKLALEMYQKGLTNESKDSKHDKLCHAGIVRMTFRLGDISKGISLALQQNDKQLFRDCAAILEGLKQYNEAATLYEKAGQFDKAVTIYLKAKNYTAVGPLMEKITSPALQKQYGQAMEEARKYPEAERAYDLGKDYDNVIRINLEKLGNIEKAFDLARKTRSPQSARLIAKFCQTKIGDFKAAIEFMLMAKLIEEAFELAQKHNEMGKFAEALGENGTPEMYLNIAQFYENKGDLMNAGNYFATCANYPKALKLFLQCGEKAINEAIDVVGKAKSDVLTRQLIDFLMGEHDGIPKDPHYIYKLHVALENWEQAAPTAVIIARQEQDLGNYKVAHKILFNTYKDLESRGIKILTELKHNLMLLHSYAVAKILIKFKDHKSGARMLIRVAKNISKFPQHDVAILTSTVIECMRAGLKKAAFDFACILVRPEYRNNIDPAYKKKIEGIVRKPDKNEEEEATAPCPNCRFELSKTELDCPSCRSTLPYCIVTGRHMVLDDWSSCPSCKFPALHSAFRKYVQSEANATCPMCDQALNINQINKDENPTAILKKLLGETVSGQAPQAGGPPLQASSTSGRGLDNNNTSSPAGGASIL